MDASSILKRHFFIAYVLHHSVSRYTKLAELKTDKVIKVSADQMEGVSLTEDMVVFDLLHLSAQPSSPISLTLMFLAVTRDSHIY